MLVLFICMSQAIIFTPDKQMPRPKPRHTFRIRDLFLSCAPAARWNFIAFAARFRQTDGDCLLAALHLASAAPGTETSAFKLAHLFSDLLLCLASIATAPCAATGALAGHARAAARSCRTRPSSASGSFPRSSLTRCCTSSTPPSAGAGAPRTCCRFPCCHG
jgi:hypothetical protein